jgi:hypothetical protein
MKGNILLNIFNNLLLNSFKMYCMTFIIFIVNYYNLVIHIYFNLSKICTFALFIL